MYLTWLDSNSWLLELSGKRILLDPWLVGPLVFGNLPWLFKGTRRQPRPIPDGIDLILLSQGLEDHAHPPTLKELDRNIPVVASENATKVVRELGYKQIKTLEHGQSYTLNNTVEIRAVPGSPIGPMLVENGYLLREVQTGVKLYYEPHGYHDESLKEFAPVDVVVTPVVNLSIPILGPVIKGMESTVKAAELLQPQVILPTAAGGDIDFQGALMSVLRAQGSTADVRSLLAQKNFTTKVIEPKPGTKFEVPLEKPPANPVS